MWVGENNALESLMNGSYVQISKLINTLVFWPLESLSFSITNSSATYHNIFLRCHWMAYCFINGFCLFTIFWIGSMENRHEHLHTHTHEPGRHSIKRISRKILRYYYEVHGLFCGALGITGKEEMGPGAISTPHPTPASARAAPLMCSIWWCSLLLFFCHDRTPPLKMFKTH